ncbi:hypothetical protein TPE_0691 [Treponema pedis str. T A4]|uniref:Uncharacterized protein n=1 Tax=Treponema pedis str. T A4 TaxID=1291379 RepID=S5ZKV1_9SPIR|nr:hypothetical protein TPE_0691 [Treponema pedis str. T A4]
MSAELFLQRISLKQVEIFIIMQKNLKNFRTDIPISAEF